MNILMHIREKAVSVWHRQNLPYHCIDRSYHRVPFTMKIKIKANFIVKSYNLLFIPDENVKDITIEKCSNDTKKGIVNPAPSLTSSSKIFVTK